MKTKQYKPLNCNCKNKIERKGKKRKIMKCKKQTALSQLNNPGFCNKDRRD